MTVPVNCSWGFQGCEMCRDETSPPLPRELAEDSARGRKSGTSQDP